MRQLRRLFGRIPHAFLCEGEARILRRWDSIREMTLGNCLISISGSQWYLLASAHIFHVKVDFALRSSRQLFTIALAAWHVLYFSSLGYGFPTSSRPVEAGEVAGVHGIFRLGGNSHMDCVADAMLLTCRLLGTESGTDCWKVLASAPKVVLATGRLNSWGMQLDQWLGSSTSCTVVLPHCGWDRFFGACTQVQGQGSCPQGHDSP